jgi:hypothetical protein
MSINCNDGVTIPQLISEECNGIYKNDICVKHPGAITALNLPANSSLNTIVNALVLAIQYKEEQIQDLQDQINAQSVLITNLTP